ncbi:molybdopterin molybdotransferase [Evansella vedderi]|uniref:Molybdopterin molybdenumtransferase n=1 Tax=Evansella vedderi TaxID=38282 RepID=A0ABT9ZUG7_9BACI|nr:gephyrin-like molybdotransferase Glp [Evansella vedderi]MDQ0254882.1 molybdopterin molybdotransferase [Evansella vedderi]
MKFFRVQSVENVMRLMETEIQPTTKVEEIPLQACLHRILAEDVTATEDVPSFTRSVVDGYAVNSKDTFGASETLPAFLDCIGEVKMGKSIERSLERGQTMYIPTGGMLPQGSDSVVMIEDCEAMEDVINVYRTVARNENIISRGEDARLGDLLIPKGKRLRPQELGALASLGKTSVTVKKQLTVGYLSSGDEIVPFQEKVIPVGKVRDVNGITIPSLAEGWGFKVKTASIARDEFDDFYEKAKSLYEECDVLVISGGSSVGTRDYTTEVIESLGDNEPGILVHGISIKPGKPTIFSMSSGKPILGLPGHPASAMIIFQLFGKKLLSLLQGEAKEGVKHTATAVVSQNIPSAPGRTDFIRVKLQEENGQYIAIPVLGKSGLVKTLVDSDGLLEIAEHKEGVNKGDSVTVHLFS